MKDGTSELKDGASDMDTKVSDQIDDMTSGITGGDCEAVSFVSEENTQVESVQFVIRTGALTIPEEEAPEAEPAEPMTVWQKFLNLFKSEEN